MFNYKQLSKLLPPIILLLITLIGAFLRFYQLGSTPKGPLVDEPAFGYSAYSILKTGRDEWGQSYPIIFKSYGDDKMPLYVYLLVPLIPIFGLTNFMTRTPAAFFGTLLIPLVYLLAVRLIKSRRAALFAALLTSFSPVFIQLSRLGRESTLGLFIFTLGIYFLVRAFQNFSKANWVLAAVFIGLSWYTYVAYRLISMIFLPILLGFYFTIKESFRSRIIIFTLILAAVVLPIMLHGNIITARVKQVGVLADPGPLMDIIEKRNYCTLKAPRQLCYLAYNKATVFSRILLQRFVRMYSPEYLFIEGDKDLLVLNVERYGQFYLTVLPLFLIGLYALWQGRNSKYKDTVFPLILIALLTTPIPAILAGEYQKMRSAPAFVFVVLVIAVGIDYLLDVFKNYQKNILSSLIILIISAQTVIFYLNLLTVHTSKFSVLYGSYMPDLISNLYQNHHGDDILIANYLPDFILNYAFYTHLDPQIYQTQTQYYPPDKLNFQHAKKLNNIQVVQEPVNKLACNLNPSNQTYYVTNIKMAKNRPVYTGKTDNGVLDLIYVYRLTENDCEKSEAK